MTFENNASLLQNTDAQNTGLIKYKRITTPIYKFDFTFWSSPVQGFTLEKLSPSTLSDKYQGYDGANSKWTTLSRTLTMSPGTAYNIRGPQGHATPAPYLATFEGTPNNGPYELTGLVAGKFYLAGNPYPSPINVLDFLDLNEDIIEGTIYFWTHATPIAPNGSVYSYGSDDYASRNYLGGTAAQPDGRIPSDYISAAQGFFMKTITTDPVRFTNDMRVSTAEGENAQFFKPGKTAKTAATSKRSRVWLSISNGLGAYKQTLLGYAEGASNSFDSKYDGVSFSANKNLNLYTLNEDKKFAIQGRAYPVQETDVVPLGYVANLEGEFSIAIDKTDGTLASQAIYLEDKLTGTIYDLKASKYTFTTAKGTFNDRFVLRYTKKTLGNDDFENVEGGLVVTVKDKVIKVTSASESIQSVTIFDLTGKLLFNKQKIEATEFAIPNLHSSEQTLLVKVGLENGTTATRKIIFN
ncbi:T9SS sorting signal type C domain-containing protein [Flavobacterium hydrocarbonoxydans]